MIQYGTYETEFQTSRPKDITCFACGAKHQMIIRGIAKGWHIFFLPIFPFRVKHEFECVNCKRIDTFREMKPEMKAAYQGYRGKRIPQFWHFSGILLLIGIWVGIQAFQQISSSREKAEIRERLEQIAVNRIIEYQTEASTYSTLKVCLVEEERLGLVQNKYVVDQAILLGKIKTHENYLSDTIIMDRKVLDEWWEEGRILSIHW